MHFTRCRKVEFGGILLGDWSGKRLTISDSRPLDCERAFGPSFTLSERDREKLAEIIASAVASGAGPSAGLKYADAGRLFFREAAGAVRSQVPHRELGAEPIEAKPEAVKAAEPARNGNSPGPAPQPVAAAARPAPPAARFLESKRPRRASGRGLRFLS